MKKFILLVLLLIVFSNANALAYERSAGMFEIPVADTVLEPYEYKLKGYSGYFPYLTTHWHSEEFRSEIDLTFGLVKNLEVRLRGFDNARNLTGVTSDFNLKVFNERDYIPSFAIGAQNIGGSSDRFVLPTQDPNTVYIVSSKHVGQLGMMHLGYGNGRFIGDEVYSEGIAGVFFGWEKEIPFGPDNRALIFAAEVDGRDINAGTKYRINSEHTITFALRELDNWFFPHPYPWDPAGKYMTVRTAFGYEYSSLISYLKITAPEDKTITRAAQILVKGRMAGMRYVTIGGKEIDVNKNTINVLIDLNIGFNFIEVDGISKNGKKYKQTIRVLRLKTFPDVPITHWAVKPIEYLATLGAIKGYPDGNFGPERLLTRAEFATLLVRLRGRVSGEIRAYFPDVEPDHWAALNIDNSVREGLVIGYPDGLFRPDNNITRAEGVTVFSRFDRLKAPASMRRTFLDIKKDHWVIPQLSAVLDAGIIDYLKGDVWFRDKKKLLRDETAEMLSKTTYGEAGIIWLLSFGEIGEKPNCVWW